MNVCKQINILFLVVLMGSISCRAQGDIRSASTRGKKHARIGLGHFENRDARFTPYIVKNFRDLLQFELVNRGYSLKQPSTKFHRTSDEFKKGADKGKRKGPTSGMLPDYLRDVAGEKPYKLPGMRVAEGNMLNTEQVAALAHHHKLDYFMQGAISRSESGNLLELEENNLVFIEVFDRNGKQAGIISIVVTGNSLSRAEFLSKVCRRVSLEFDRDISRHAPEKPESKSLYQKLKFKLTNF